MSKPANFDPIRVYKYVTPTENKTYVDVYFVKKNLYRLQNKRSDYELSSYDQEDEYLTSKQLLQRFNPILNIYNVIYFGDNETDDKEYYNFMKSEFPPEKQTEEEKDVFSDKIKEIKCALLLSKLPQQSEI